MLKNTLIQIFLVVIIFHGYSWYKESSMLAKDEAINVTSVILPSISGKSIDVLKSKKNTVLYFFAPWCPVCNLSIGNLESLHQSDATLEIIAIALDYQTIEEVEEYAVKHQLTFPIVFGNSQTKKQFNISAYPSYYVLNKQKQVVARSIGYSSEFGLYLRTMDLY